ncbi:MAG: glycosyltransferase family 2 protein [Peptococcaceae bacterium]|nr:glycosyltransferase family 2 protein [Peptococcaceae bacterium]
MRCVVIIPAFNEEKTVGAVVAAAKQCALVAEVVVVSDGSKDRTAKVAASAGATVIALPENRGKGGAMQAGLSSVPGDVYLFLDADLIGLTKEHVAHMLEPIIAGRVEVTLGLFGKGRLATDLAQKIAPFLSGQRALSRSVLSQMPDFSTAGWGVEVVVNRHLQATGVPVEEILLHNVTQVMKEEKSGLVRGAISRLRMYWQIFQALGRKGRATP